MREDAKKGGSRRGAEPQRGRASGRHSAATTLPNDRCCRAIETHACHLCASAPLRENIDSVVAAPREHRHAAHPFFSICAAHAAFARSRTRPI
jgi:hypothetical protein